MSVSGFFFDKEFQVLNMRCKRLKVKVNINDKLVLKKEES